MAFLLQTPRWRKAKLVSKRQIHSEILLPTEEILWQHLPALDLAKPIKPFWRRKAVHLAWTLIVWGVVAFLLNAIAWFGLEGAAHTVASVVIVGIALAALLSTVSWFVFQDETAELLRQECAITNRRIIIKDTKTNEIVSLFPNSVLYMHRKRNGSVHDLELQHSHEEFSVTLFAVEDVDAVEKLILERFVTITEAEK